MRALAEFIMRGRVQATLVVVGCAALPLLFWLSAAAGSLVFLRRGFKDASSVIAWGLLPAMVMWYFGEPSTLLVFLGTLGLAARPLALAPPRLYCARHADGSQLAA